MTSLPRFLPILDAYLLGRPGVAEGEGGIAPLALARVADEIAKATAVDGLMIGMPPDAMAARVGAGRQASAPTFGALLESAELLKRLDLERFTLISIPGPGLVRRHSPESEVDTGRILKEMVEATFSAGIDAVAVFECIDGDGIGRPSQRFYRTLLKLRDFYQRHVALFRLVGGEAPGGDEAQFDLRFDLGDEDHGLVRGRGDPDHPSTWTTAGPFPVEGSVDSLIQLRERTTEMARSEA